MVPLILTHSDMAGKRPKPHSTLGKGHTRACWLLATKGPSRLTCLDQWLVRPALLALLLPFWTPEKAKRDRERERETERGRERNRERKREEERERERGRERERRTKRGRERERERERRWGERKREERSQTRLALHRYEALVLQAFA